MLRGESVELRPVRENDLDFLFMCLSDIRTRGDYFPLNISTQPGLRRQFQEDGFWRDDRGLLFMTRPGAAIIGHIEFYKPVAYLDAYEFSYQLYDPGERSKGVTTEAVHLLAEYLFDTKKVNRL